MILNHYNLILQRKSRIPIKAQWQLTYLWDMRKAGPNPASVFHSDN